MFNFNNVSQNKALDEAIDDLLVNLKTMEPTDHGYSESADEVIKLMKLKKELNSSWRPSPDALVGLAGSLITVVLILHHEKFGVITSKAMSFVTKLK